MRGRPGTILVLIGVLTLVLASCGTADEAQQIAQDACDLMEQMAAGDPEDFDPEMFEEFEQLEARAQEAGISDEDMQQAVEDECPEVFEGLGGG